MASPFAQAAPWGSWGGTLQAGPHPADPRSGARSGHCRSPCWEGAERRFHLSVVRVRTQLCGDMAITAAGLRPTWGPRGLQSRKCFLPGPSQPRPGGRLPPPTAAGVRGGGSSRGQLSGRLRGLPQKLGARGGATLCPQRPLGEK